jgi:hypothetical protein
MSDLLPPGRARDALKGAEQALTEGDVKACLREARLALEHGLRETNGQPPGTDRASYNRRKKRLRPHHSSFHSAFHLGLNKVDRKFGEAWDELRERAERTETAVFLMARGVDYEEYVLFRSLTPAVFFAIGREEPVVTDDGTGERILSEARWCVTFVTQALLALTTTHEAPPK